MPFTKHTPLGAGCVCQSCTSKRNDEMAAPKSPISDDFTSARAEVAATTPRNKYILRPRDESGGYSSPTRKTPTSRRLFALAHSHRNRTDTAPPAADNSWINSSRSPSLKPSMSSQQGKWREEQVLIICPGSQTTLAQLGCNELTPPAHRFPTRMFKGDSEDEWRPYHTYKRKKAGAANGASDAVAADKATADDANDDDDSYEWIEDTDSTEGAVYPIQAGRIVNMPAFLAFLDHVHSQLTTTYHNTPILLMASPQWVRGDVEMITRYIFEKTRTPALCIIHSGLATQYGLKWPSMTVVDIGYKKVDVTCIFEGSVVGHSELGYPGPERWISGGEVFTQKLLGLLKDKDFSYEMAEQLKKSHICEVLPYAPGKPDAMELPTASSAAAPPTGPEPSKPVVAAELPKPAPVIAETDDAADEVRAEEDGVLDVATIVTSGNAREFLAKKEKEKIEKAKGRKAKAQEAEAAKAVRLPNSKRTHNIFHYEEVVQETVYPEAPAPIAAAVATTSNGTNGTNGAAAAPAPAVEENKDVDMTDAAPAPEAPAEEAKPADAPVEGEKPAAEEEKPAAEGEKAPEAVETAPAAEEVKPETETPAPAPASAPAPAPAPATEVATIPAAPQEPRIENRRVRRDIEVGLERFKFADRDEIDRIVTTIYRTIQGLYEMYMRPACWDNLVFVGNGSRLRGLKENIMQRLLARHLVSPSTATMFTSELPSNIATPTGTGAQTPTGSFTGAPHQLPTASSGVNPLLQAATTASGFGVAGGPGTPGGPSGGSEIAGGHQHQSHFHSQTPTSIKLAPLPTYLTEWTKHGFEESMFLGAQVAARLAFCVHNLDMSGLEAQKMMSLSRVDYNELGPKGIREHSMLK